MEKKILETSDLLRFNLLNDPLIGNWLVRICDIKGTNACHDISHISEISLTPLSDLHFSYAICEQ